MKMKKKKKRKSYGLKTQKTKIDIFKIKSKKTL